MCYGVSTFFIDFFRKIKGAATSTYRNEARKAAGAAARRAAARKAEARKVSEHKSEMD